MSDMPKVWSEAFDANWFFHCFRGLFAGPSKKRRGRGSRSRRRSHTARVEPRRSIRSQTHRSGECTSPFVEIQAVPEIREPPPNAPEVAQALAEVAESQPEVVEAQPEVVKTHPEAAEAQSDEIGAKALEGSFGTPAVPERGGLAASQALAPEEPESIPRPLSPRAAALQDLAPAAGIEASPALVAMLMYRVRHTGLSPARNQRQITSSTARPQVAYQVQVSAPIEGGNGLPAGPGEASSLAVNTVISPMGSALVLQALEEAAPAAAGAAILSRRINVPWALFPYLFDLVPAIDGVPCDGLLMLGRLVAVMSSSGFRLKAASKCPGNDASTMLELHGGATEKEWKVLQDSIWAWGIVVMNMRVPLEQSPNRSLILQMFD